VTGPVRLRQLRPLSERGGLDLLLDLGEYARVTADADSAACRIEPYGPRPGAAAVAREAGAPAAVARVPRSVGSSSTLEQWQEVRHRRAADAPPHAALAAVPPQAQPPLSALASAYPSLTCAT